MTSDVETVSTIAAKKAAGEDGLRYYLSYARSVLFTNNLIYLYTALCGTASLCGSLFDARGRWQHGCARFWSWLILKTGGIRVRVEGLERVNPHETLIFCSNHPSAMDIPILFVHLPVQFRFVAKRELFRLPFLGWHLRRSGHIPVDRGRPREALRKGHSGPSPGGGVCPEGFTAWGKGKARAQERTARRRARSTSSIQSRDVRPQRPRSVPQ